MTELVTSLKLQHQPCHWSFVSWWINKHSLKKEKKTFYRLQSDLVTKTELFLMCSFHFTVWVDHGHGARLAAFNVSGSDSCQFPWCTLRSQGLGSQKQGQSQLISHFCCFSALGPGSLPADNNMGHTYCINDWSALPPALTQLLYFNMILHHLRFGQKLNLIKRKHEIYVCHYLLQSKLLQHAEIHTAQMSLLVVFSE